MTPDPEGSMPEAAGPVGGEFRDSHVAAVNEALLLSSLREHERREDAELLAAERGQRLDVAQLATLAAEKANSAKDYLLATLSHELRTPLNPVLLLASEGARNLDLPPLVREDFAAIEKNILLETRLIDELLDYTRAVRGKIDLHMVVVPLNDILRDAVGNVRVDIEARSLQVAIEYFPGDPLVRGDAVRLQQVFWNILKNAAKFTPPGGLVRLQTTADAERNLVTIRISDSGLGIRRSELANIFGAFNQAGLAESSPRPRGGLGLGLAIAKTIVELHAGTIRAESPGPGQGSTFTVELPMERAGRRVPSSPDQPSRPDGHDLALHGPRLLLVEHDPDSQLAMQRILTSRGLVVVCASSRAEARRLAAEANFDILLTDVGLADGEGLGLLRSVADSSPGVRGIALTGHGTPADRVLSQAAGYAVHLVKPISIATLENGLAAALAAKPPFVGSRH